MANTVRILITAKDEVSGPLDKIRDKATMLSKTDIGKGILQGIGIGAFQALSGAASQALDAVVNFAVGSIQAASDQREAMALTEQVFEDSTESVKEWSRNTHDAFSSREAMTFASSFGTAFKNVGFALDEVTAKSKEMTTLAGDLGSAFNTSSEEAATALRSGLLGESEPLRRFGVFLDEAKVKAKAAAMGMEILGGKLTDGQKVAARYALIMEQTADSQGMFGRDTESLADASKLLQTNLDDLQARIGEDLLPIMVDLSTWVVEDGIPAIEGLLDALEEAGPIFDTFGTGFRAALDPKGMLEDWKAKQDEVAEKAEDVAGRVVRAAQETREPYVEMRREFVKTAQGAGKAEAGISDLGDATHDTAKDFADLKKKVKDALGVLLDPSPKELRLSLEGAKLEGKQLERKLRDLENVKNPTRQTRADIIDTKLAIIDNQKEIVELSDSLTDLDKTRLDRHENLVRRLAGKWGAATDAVDDYIAAVRDVDGATASGQGRGGHRNSKSGGIRRAGGGPIPPYGSALVGENGPEIIRLGGLGGMVSPSTGVQTTAGGGSLTINVSTPLMTPGAAQALADLIAPSITRWQQVRGV